MRATWAAYCSVNSGDPGSRPSAREVREADRRGAHREQGQPHRRRIEIRCQLPRVPAPLQVGQHLLEPFALGRLRRRTRRPVEPFADDETGEVGCARALAGVLRGELGQRRARVGEVLLVAAPLIADRVVEALLAPR
jgi:hypothetical protein